MKFLTIFIALICSNIVLSKPSEKKIKLALDAARVQLTKDENLKKSELPHVVIQKVQKFLQENPAFVQSVIVQSAAEPLTDTFRYKDRLMLHKAHKKELLTQMKLDNYANNVNTIIRIPGITGYFVRISGELHRDSNALCTLGHRSNRGYDLFVKQERGTLRLEDEQELDAFKIQNPKTIQTISQIGFYKMVHKAIAIHKIKTIRIPVTGLVHVPGRPQSLEDKNYVVVQQELQNCFSLWEHPELRKKVTKQQIADIKKVIVCAGLWDVKKNLFLCYATEQYPCMQLGLIDFEQPNRSSSDYPSYLDDERRVQLAKHGLAELRELLVNDHPEEFES